jgi:N-acetylneuraminate synthase
MSLADLIKGVNAGEGSKRKPYLIAEAGVNHEGDINLAKRLIDEAKLGGADAIKFQTYKADKIASKHSPAYWDLNAEPTTSQHELFKKYDTFWKGEFEQLSKYCEEVEIEFLSTPFDAESAAFLAEMMSVFKISSSDLNNKPFIEFLCKFNKPIILSTGASYLWEVEQAVSWIEDAGIDVALLHCVLNYPTTDSNANLSVIKTLKEKFPKNVVGYSDHTLPKDMTCLQVATVMGAEIIEKHFTHDKTLPGNDHYHAMDYKDIQIFRSRVDLISSLSGKSKREPLPSETISRLNARRSLVLESDIEAGVEITEEYLTWKRPGTGIDPRFYDSVLGMRVTKDLKKDHVLQWGDLS